MLFFCIIISNCTFVRMRQIFYLSILLITSLAYAQESDQSRYKEDQFYIDVNFPLQFNDINAFKQNGFSRSLHIGYLNDIPLNQKGNKALAIGLGYGYLRLVNNLNVRKSNGQFNYTFPTNNINLRNTFFTHQIQLPVEFRWRTSTFENHAFWRFYLGYRLNYQFAGRYKPFFGSKFSITDQINPWQHSFSITLGYNTWNFRFEYGITPFLKESIQAENRQPTRIYPIQIGLIFYLL